MKGGGGTNASDDDDDENAIIASSIGALGKSSVRQVLGLYFMVILQFL
jgi:hypothetical protein